MNKKTIGKEKEELASNFLIQNGLNIIDINFRCHFGEVDIICKDNDYLVFTEVKYRSGTTKGYAAEAVNYPKQKKICRVCDYYCMKNNLSNSTPIRFDVIAIDSDKVNWIKNAFEYIPIYR